MRSSGGALTSTPSTSHVDTVAIEVVRLAGRLDLDRDLLFGRALVDVAQRQHRAGHRRPGDTTLAAAGLDRAQSSVGDPAIAVGDRRRVVGLPAHLVPRQSHVRQVTGRPQIDSGRRSERVINPRRLAAIVRCRRRNPVRRASPVAGELSVPQTFTDGVHAEQVAGRHDACQSPCVLDEDVTHVLVHHLRGHLGHGGRRVAPEQDWCERCRPPWSTGRAPSAMARTMSCSDTMPVGLSWLPTTTALMPSPISTRATSRSDGRGIDAHDGVADQDVDAQSAWITHVAHDRSLSTIALEPPETVRPSSSRHDRAVDRRTTVVVT